MTSGPFLYSFSCSVSYNQYPEVNWMLLWVLTLFLHLFSALVRNFGGIQSKSVGSSARNMLIIPSTKSSLENPSHSYISSFSSSSNTSGFSSSIWRFVFNESKWVMRARYSLSTSKSDSSAWSSGLGTADWGEVACWEGVEEGLAWFCRPAMLQLGLD